MTNTTVIPAATIARWRELRRMGYSLRQIAHDFRVGANTVRYHTDYAYQERTKEQLRIKYIPAEIRKKYTRQPATFSRAEDAMPELVLPELFEAMPPWPKPLWLANFEARHG